jgi:hypothetical protein
LGLRRDERTGCPVIGSTAARCGTWWRGQDPSDCGRVQAELGGQDDSAALAAAPGSEHFALHFVASACWHPDGSRGPVGQGRIATFVVSTQPLVDRRAGNTQLFNDMGRRPASGDTFNDETSSENIGAGVSVRHEDLLRVDARHIHSVRRSSLFQAGTPSTTSQVTTTSRQPRRGHQAAPILLARS